MVKVEKFWFKLFSIILGYLLPLGSHSPVFAMFLLISHGFLLSYKEAGKIQTSQLSQMSTNDYQKHV